MFCSVFRRKLSPSNSHGASTWSITRGFLALGGAGGFASLPHARSRARKPRKPRSSGQTSPQGLPRSAHERILPQAVRFLPGKNTCKRKTTNAVVLFTWEEHLSAYIRLSDSPCFWTFTLIRHVDWRCGFPTGEFVGSNRNRWCNVWRHQGKKILTSPGS